MNELKRLFGEPRLSPFFATRVTASLKREPRLSRWMVAYWAGVIGFGAFALAQVSWPEWAIGVAIPASFALALASRRAVLKVIEPFLR